MTRELLSKGIRVLPWIVQFILPLGIANIAFPALISFTRRRSLLDHPDPLARQEKCRQRKIHTEPTPRLGGLVLVGAFLAALPFVEMNTAVFKLICGGLSMFLVGFIDDIRPLSAKIKLSLQFAIAASVVFSAGLSMPSFSFIGYHIQSGPVLGGFFSTLLIVGVLNSINMIDGLDGLAAGVSLIGVSLLSYSYFFESRDTWILLTISLAVFGSILGFLRFNTFPARIFMGDGGSHWLGYICGVLAVVTIGGFEPGSTGKFLSVADHQTDLLTALACLAVPVGDTVALTIHRLRAGGHPFQADNSHIHHMFQSNGYSQRRAVIALYTIAFGLGFVGLLPIIYPSYWSYEVSFALLLCFFVYLNASKSHQIGIKKGPNRLSTKILSLAQSASWSRSGDAISRRWAAYSRVAIYALLLAAPFFSSPSNVGLGKFQVLFALVLAATMFAKIKKRDFTLSLLVVMSISTALLSLNQNPLEVSYGGVAYSLQSVYNACFVLLAVSVAVYTLIDFSRRGFVFSSTDFLLILMPLLLILVPEPYNSRYYLTITSLRAMVLFIALRTFVFRHKRALSNVRMVTLVTLLHLAAIQFL